MMLCVCRRLTRCDVKMLERLHTWENWVGCHTLFHMSALFFAGTYVERGGQCCLMQNGVGRCGATTQCVHFMRALQEELQFSDAALFLKLLYKNISSGTAFICYSCLFRCNVSVISVRFSTKSHPSIHQIYQWMRDPPFL